MKTKIIFSLLCLLSFSGHTEIHKWVDEHGQTHFGDKVPLKYQKTSAKQEGLHSSRGRPLSGKKYNSEREVKARTSSLFQQGKFSELERVLHQLLKQTLSDITAENNLQAAYDIFNTKSPDNLSLHEQWIQQSPRSYEAYLARAHYYYAAAWGARGGGRISKVKPQNIADMRMYLDKAVTDLEQAIKLESRVTPAHALKIKIFQTLGLNKQKESALSRGLGTNKYSYSIRSAYLSSITPSWGGSYPQMKSFIEKTLKYSRINPRLKLLQASPYITIARELERSNLYTEAEQVYSEALKLGDNHRSSFGRGFTRYKLKKYNAALKDLSKAISLYKEDENYYYWRAKTFAELKEFKKSLHDIGQAAKINPRGKNIQNLREWIGTQFNRQGQVIKPTKPPASPTNEIDQAILNAPYSAKLYFERAKLHIKNRHPRKAEKDLKKAIKLAPKTYEYYLKLDETLIYERRFSTIISYWEKYIALAPLDKRAYLEVSGTYYHQGDIKSAVRNAKIARDLGHPKGPRYYKKFKSMLVE